jgi:hypothetical protein
LHGSQGLGIDNGVVNAGDRFKEGKTDYDQYGGYEHFYIPALI